MPKSSTTSVNYIGFETWENKPGVWGNSKYPCFANRFLRSLFARMNRISMYTYPLCILSCSSYWFMNSAGIKLAFIFMYLNLSSGVAPGVLIVEFQRILDVVRSAVLVVSSPGYSMRLPPTVIRTRLGSSFCGR